jgi:hypothetical protein
MQRELMRHASIQTTMNVYGRPSMTEAKRRMNSSVVKMALKPLLSGGYGNGNSSMDEPFAPSYWHAQLTGRKPYVFDGKVLEGWLRGVDLNHRPLGYEPNELPDCSTPHFDHSNAAVHRQTCIPACF